MTVFLTYLSDLNLLQFQIMRMEEAAHTETDPDGSQ